MTNPNAETTLAVIRAGGDLQVAIERRIRQPAAGYLQHQPEQYIVQAFDSDGNALARLGVFSTADQAFELLPTLIGLAREMYGPRHPRDESVFDMTAWTTSGPATLTESGWAWAADRLDETLGNDVQRRPVQ